YAVTTRRREIGIRVAFGASAANLVRHVLARGLRVAGAGLLTGIVAALFTSRLLASELFQVEASDPLVLTGTALVVLLTAVLACLIPARRAAAVEPMNALRQEGACTRQQAATDSRLIGNRQSKPRSTASCCQLPAASCLLPATRLDY